MVYFATRPKMTSLFSSLFLVFTLLPISCVVAFSSNYTNEHFLRCLTSNSTSISDVVFTRQHVLYPSILDSAVQNLRFSKPHTPKPMVIITPVLESHIRTAIHCSKLHNVQMRIRGGGHDFEGLSYVSHIPFAMLDMINFRSINIDVENRTAWVQGGANLGEFYYSIAQKSQTLGFPAGVWSTVGIGGHISGGGYGMMIRKYGIAADYVIDAHLMDVNGRILDRKTMGEDLFWAIRGGGGGTFGVILAWKLKLVEVPKVVTTFRVVRSVKQNATKLLHRWQYVATKIDRDLFIRPLLLSSERNKVIFNSLFLGEVNSLLSLMQERFPELGLVKEDCTEMSWIQSCLHSSGFSIEQPLNILLNRSATPRFFSKGKSDYVQEPISQKGINLIWKSFFKHESVSATMEMNPYGGIMSEIPESSIPFPHRAGNLFMLFEGVSWSNQTSSRIKMKRINWLRNFHKFLTPYVSNSPRAAYMDYIDLDLGISTESYEKASIWGKKYFKDNFKRLVRVKSKVDPSDFFSHQQGIPSFSSLI